MELLQRHIITSEATVKDALQAINSLSGEDSMTLFVVMADGKVGGTITDGDIRRALISGCSLEENVAKVMHRGFLSAPLEGNRYEAVRAAGKRKIDLLPVLDAEGRPAGVIDLRRQRTALPVDAVLMAGGKGERLRPLTLTTPKPLLKIGGKPIIDYNVEELINCGIENIFVTVNYLHEQIEEHFRQPRFSDVVKCVLEPCRLGTMGSVALIDGFKHDNIIVMNSDLLTTLNFEKLYERHIEAGADLTIATIPYTVSIPFAIVEEKDGRVTGLTEKPTYNYFANAGVYIMKREAAERIPKNEYLDAPDFIESVIANGGKVATYTIEGRWTDIGSPDDFRYANELMSR